VRDEGKPREFKSKKKEQSRFDRPTRPWEEKLLNVLAQGKEIPGGKPSSSFRGGAALLEARSRLPLKTGEDITEKKDIWGRKKMQPLWRSQRRGAEKADSCETEGGGVSR